MQGVLLFQGQCLVVLGSASYQQGKWLWEESCSPREPGKVLSQFLLRERWQELYVIQGVMNFMLNMCWPAYLGTVLQRSCRQ